jgi:uncharacterized protein
MSIAPVSTNYSSQSMLDYKPESSSGSDPKDIQASVVKAATVPAKEVQSIKANNFFDKLLARNDQVSKKNSLSEMQAKLADIKHLGTLVKQHPEPNVVKSYVSELRSFLTQIRDSAYEEQRSDDDLFEKINIVDQKLDELADELLLSQKTEMQIVNSLGVLEGLLIDIFV